MWQKSLRFKYISCIITYGGFMANYTQIDKLIEIADNRSVRTVLMSSVSAITLAGCMGGGGGGTFGVFGGGSGGNARLMGGQLVKGTVVNARVFQDVDVMVFLITMDQKILHLQIHIL